SHERHCRTVRERRHEQWIRWREVGGSGDGAGSILDPPEARLRRRCVTGAHQIDDPSQHVARTRLGLEKIRDGGCVFLDVARRMHVHGRSLVAVEAQPPRCPAVTTCAITYPAQGSPAQRSSAPCARPRQSTARRNTAVASVTTPLIKPPEPGRHVVKTTPMKARTHD